VANLIDTVTIVGLGLIGGSLGLAIKKKGLARKVIALALSRETIKEGKERGAIDEGTLSLKKGVKSADLLFIAVPTGSIVKMIKKSLPYLKEGCIITDVGSTKFDIVKEVEGFLPKRFSFIGGHPLAGSEESGIKAARLSLFKGSTYVLTPQAKADSSSLSLLKSLIKGIGAKVLILSPEVHDALLARTSHLPHLLATSLVNTVEDLGKRERKTFKVLTPGFKDTTRIAKSSSALWQDICLSNQRQILKALSEFKEHLKKIERSIKEKDLAALGKQLNRANRILKSP